MSRRTAQKSAISCVIESAERPLTAHEILDEAQAAVPSLGIATVYRHLRALVEREEIIAVELPGEAARYEPAGRDHHHHFRCNECERVFDVPGCHSTIERGVPDQFVVQSHEVVLYGLCADCNAP